jgi:hypothetical protein
MSVVPTGLGQPTAAMTVVGPVAVTTPSGQQTFVLGQAEEQFYVSQSQKYLDDYAYTNVSDLLDLDRLLFLELQAFRLSQWLGTGRDYDGVLVDNTQQRRALKEASDLISKVKNDLGMTKSQRDKEREASVSAYLTTLKQRAKEFGVHREKQLIKGITLCQQLFSIIGSFDRADSIERDKLGFTSEAEIVDWIRTVMRPEFDAVDAHFRQNQQRYWLKDL